MSSDSSTPITTASAPGRVAIPTTIVEEPEAARRLRELAAHSSAGVSEAGVLALLRHRNHDTNGQIQSIMSRMDERTSLAERLTTVLNELLALKSKGDAHDDGALGDGPGDGGEATRALMFAASAHVEEFGIHMLVGTNDVGGSILTADQMDDAIKQVENQLKQANQGNDLDMIELQSLMQQRTSDMQLASNLLKAMTESTQTIVGNIR